MRFRPTLFALVIAFLWGLAAPSRGQPPLRESGFSLNAHAFLDPERRPSVLVSVDIPYSSLIFLKKDGLFQSEYSVFVKVLDKKKKIVESAVLTENVVSEDYEATRSARMTSKASKRFHLPQGEYVIDCMIQVKDTQRVFEKQAPLTVPEFIDTGIGVGKPRLYAVDVDTSGSVPVLSESGRFQGLGEKELETPFFAALDKQLMVKFDVYSEDETSTSLDCILLFEVVDEKREVRAYARGRARIEELRNQFSVYLDVDEWDPGKYVFVAKAVQPEPLREVTSSLSFVLAYTKTMLTKHFDRTIALLSLIASNDEIAELKDAGEADRPGVWAAFWSRRDPTPGTEENEALEEHFRRVRYAIDNFSDASSGWESDRGKVYIKYGEPDHTEFKMDPQYQGEFLVWYYYEENMRFVFYDRFGLGEYRLTDAGQI